MWMRDFLRTQEKMKSIWRGVSVSDVEDNDEREQKPLAYITDNGFACSTHIRATKQGETSISRLLRASTSEQLHRFN
jgi:hypothetical protein